MPNTIDPLAYEERLTKAGVPAEQAHVHAEVIGQVKAELEILESETPLARLEAKLDGGVQQLNTKIDRTKVELESKIDQARSDLDQTRIELNAKIDQTRSDLDAKVDQARIELNAKIDQTRSDLDAKIDRTRADLEKLILKTKWETIRWTIGIVFTICSLQGYVIVSVLQ